MINTTVLFPIYPEHENVQMTLNTLQQKAVEEHFSNVMARRLEELFAGVTDVDFKTWLVTDYSFEMVDEKKSPDGLLIHNIHTGVNVLLSAAHLQQLTNKDGKEVLNWLHSLQEVEEEAQEFFDLLEKNEFQHRIPLQLSLITVCNFFLDEEVALEELYGPSNTPIQLFRDKGQKAKCTSKELQQMSVFARLQMPLIAKQMQLLEETYTFLNTERNKHPRLKSNFSLVDELRKFDAFESEAAQMAYYYDNAKTYATECVQKALEKNCKVDYFKCLVERLLHLGVSSLLHMATIIATFDGDEELAEEDRLLQVYGAVLYIAHQLIDADYVWCDVNYCQGDDLIVHPNIDESYIEWELV